MSSNKISKAKSKPTTGAKPQNKKKTRNTIEEAQKLLNKKSATSTSTLDLEVDDDSSDEELLVRTGNVPREWYKHYEHAGYDIKQNKVIKPKEDDEIESFVKKANDKNWWRNIYDEMNNKSIYISDKDLQLLKRIRSNLFADKNVENEEYFENSIPYQITPISGHIPSKKSFELSAGERKRINRIIWAYNHGFMKLDDEEVKEHKEILEDIWVNDNTDPTYYYPGKGYQAPKRELPDSDVSYNPPKELIAELNLQAFNSMRRIPKYDKILDENMERCCDLVMSTRAIRKKQNIKEEDILPQLPKPEELKPFPTKENIVYKGHSSSIRGMIVEPSGKFLISSDNGGFIYFWDIQTAKIIKRMDISDTIQNIGYNSTLNLITICGKDSVYFLVPPFLPKWTKYELIDVINNKIKPLIQGNDKDEKHYQWKIPKENSAKERNGIMFYLKWKEGQLENLTWHSKGDYFATLSKNSLGKTQVFIHSLSKLIHQSPFSKVNGNINDFSFHPKKPYFLVATNSNIFVYNLQKQVNTLFNFRKWLENS
jgi:ribosome biogenesis protein ERB1